jgi:SAM-dependent methyltransferase
VKEFYESFWADLPRDPEPFEWERRRALLLAEAKPGERVLDLGCGAGRFMAALRDAGAEPVGVEIAAAAVRRARENVPGAEVHLLGPDGTLPLGHGEVDLVWCSEVLEHIPDVAAMLFEVRRVLKRGGRLLLTVPYHGRLQAAAVALTRFDRHFDPLGQHVRFFTRRSLARTLEASGFAPVEIRPEGGPPLVRRSLVALAQRG